MKNCIGILVSLLLSACYSVTYDSTLSMSGVISDVLGNPQTFDLNDKASVCVSLRLDHRMPHGELTYCQPLSTGKDGKFSAKFSPRGDNGVKSSSSSLEFGFHYVANVVDARIFIVPANGGEIEGDVIDFKKNGKAYSVMAAFLLNKAEYKPDLKLEINQVQKPYSRD